MEELIVNNTTLGAICTWSWCQFKTKKGKVWWNWLALFLNYKKYPVRMREWGSRGLRAVRKINASHQAIWEGFRKEEWRAGEEKKRFFSFPTFLSEWCFCSVSKFIHCERDLLYPWGKTCGHSRQCISILVIQRHRGKNCQNITKVDKDIWFISFGTDGLWTSLRSAW